MLKQIAEHINDHLTIKTVIDIENGQVTMMVTFSPKVDDAALSGLPPIVITGTPEEVESEFIEFIKSPSVAQIARTASGVSDFEKATQKAAEENKAAKDLKDKVQKLLEKGEKHLKDEDLKKAEQVRDEILTLSANISGKKWNDFNKGVTEALKEANNGQVSLLDQITDEKPKLDPDVETRGKDSRAVEFGVSLEQAEIIQEEMDRKYNINNGNTETESDF